MIFGVVLFGTLFDQHSGQAVEDDPIVGIIYRLSLPSRDAKLVHLLSRRIKALLCPKGHRGNYGTKADKEQG